jgi:hypothetical protein
MKKFLLFVLTFMLGLQAYAATLYFNVIYKATGTSYGVNTQSLTGLTLVTGNTFKFTSANPADVSFSSGNNENGILSYYTTSGSIINIYGTISRQDKSGNTTLSVNFIPTNSTYATPTGEAYILVVPGKESSYTNGSSASTSSDPIDPVLNAILTTQQNSPILSIADTSVLEDAGYAYFRVYLSVNATSNLTFSPSLTNGTAVAGTDYTNSFQYNNGGTWTTATSFTIANNTKTIYIRVPIINYNNQSANKTFTISTGTTTGGGVLNNAGATGTGTILIPVITLAGNNFTAFTSNAGVVSSSQNYTVSGTNLVGNITLTPPTGYELSLSSGGTYTPTLSLTPSSNTVSSTTIYTRLSKTAQNAASGTIAHTSTSAITQNKTVLAAVISGNTGTIAASPSSIAANGTSTSTITVQLKDASNTNLTTGGATVTIFTTSGTVGSVTDNNNGTYTATLTSSNTITTATISFKVNNVSSSATASVNFTGNAPNITAQPTPQTICSNTTLSLSVTATAYASGTLSYQWRKNGVAISGATSATYSKAGFSSADEGTYDVVISEAGNSYQATSNGVAVALSPITWNGNTNSQSNNSSNWLCGTQPTATSNVEFIASPGNVMQLQNDLEINNLNIGNSANSIIDLNANTLKINGAISGTIKIKGGASAKLIIAGANSKTIYFPTQNDAKLGHLKIDHPSADITLDGDVEIYDSLVINQGNLNINGLVTLKTTSCSGANATTSVAQIGRFNGSSLTYLSAGKVRVERCFPADRSYRTVTSPVTTTTSMWDNWQEAGVYVAGYGTLITGSNLGFGANSGIDNNQTGVPSIYKYNNQTQAWANITTGTKNITLQAGEPYLLMVRGDRNPQTVTSNTATANNTILRATGTLVSGDFTYTSTTTVNGVQLAALNNQYSLVGNPYASKIVWDSIYNNSTNISENIWIWDPHKNGTSAMGAYSSYNKTSGGIAGEQINKYIQPWQSFFVKNTADAPVLRLKDPFKQLDGTTARTFKTTSNFDAKLSVKLFLKQQADSGYHSDALLIAMDEQFENTKGKGDCDKFMNIDESIYMLSSDSAKLSIGSFKTPQSVSFDTIQLYTSNLKSNQYVLRFNSSDIIDPSLKMYILDRYQNSIQAINNNGTTDLDFTITSDPLSSSNKRWFIIYNKLAAPTAIANLQVSTIKIVPNPANNVIKVFIPSTEVGVVKATVVDIFGKQQQVQYLQTNEYNEMDITALAPGIYMLQTNNGNRVEQTKFIKL